MHSVAYAHQLDTLYRVGVEIVNIFIYLLLICPYSQNNIPGIGAFGFFGRHNGGNVDCCLLHSAFDLGLSAKRLQALCVTVYVRCGSLRDRVVWLALCA